MGTFIIILLWKKTFRRAKDLAWAVGCISVYAKEKGGLERRGEVVRGVPYLAIRIP